MRFTTSICLTILSYCSAVTALAMPAPDPRALYGEDEHNVNLPHPHFKKRAETIVHQIDYDASWLWKDPPSCGYTHGEPFNWMEQNRYYRFRHPVVPGTPEQSELSHIHMWAGDRINSIKMEWADRIDGRVVGHGGKEVPHSPMKIWDNGLYANGMISSCCQKDHHTRLCYAQILSNKDGDRNMLTGGIKSADWRTSKPACCRVVAAYGQAGAEVDSFNLLYIKNEDYNALTKPMPGWPNQPPVPGQAPGLERRDFTVGQQSNKRALATEIMGDHNTEKYKLINHDEHVEDHFRISKIVTYCSDRVEGIQLTYTNLNDPTQTRTSEFHGMKKGQLREMDLSKGDYVHTVDNSNCNDAESGRSQVCGLVFHTFLMQKHACGQSTITGQSQSIAGYAMLSVTGAHEGETLKSIGINWIPVEDHH